MFKSAVHAVILFWLVVGVPIVIMVFALEIKYVLGVQL
jgi:hypothetical protein